MIARITSHQQPTSLGKPIPTMLAMSDSLKASAEAVEAEAVEAPEVPGFDSLVSILWSEADLRLIVTKGAVGENIKIAYWEPCKRLRQLFVFNTAGFLGRSFQSCRFSFSFISCSSSRQPEILFLDKCIEMQLSLHI